MALSNMHAIETRVAPIVFIGMHRSGTSILSNLLNNLGLETGWCLDHDESVFFQKLNIYVERVCNCGWDNPEPLEWLNKCHHARTHVLQHLSKEVRSFKGALLFGKWRGFQYRSIPAIQKQWGWKDPRNTFTWDVWRELFPTAKVVHIYRNGVDVAASLRKREMEEPPAPESVYSSVRCCDLQGGFDLWRSYVGKAIQVVNGLGEEQAFSIKYEDFLNRPIEVMKQLVSFCGLPQDQALMEKVARTLDPSRAFQFKGKAELEAFYRQVQNDPLMLELGYGEVR